MNRSLIVLAVAIAAALLAFTGCGGEDNDAPRPASASTATLDVANGDLGNILVDSQGHTLYLFEKDSGTTSACSGECATQWPPARTGVTPTVGSGLTASKVSTTPRSDGQPQVTYNGHPLYRFAGDKHAGDASGQGIDAFGANWYVVSAAGDEITKGGGGNGY
jgi:predicted lipoprotein with Yx(FWY)xxD motif